MSTTAERALGAAESLADAGRAIGEKWSDEGAEESGDGIRGQISQLVDLVRTTLDEGTPPAVDGRATALRLRLLNELRRSFLSTFAPNDDATAGDALAVVRALQEVHDALEEDWSRRFGLGVAGPSGMDVAAEIAHGLRSSCTSLLFAAEVLREGMYGELNPKQEQQVEILYGGAVGLTSSLSDITELAWRTEEPGDGSPERFSLDDELDRVQRLLRPMAEAKGTDFIVSGPESPMRSGHPRALRQALLHLVLHGLLAAEGGRVEVTLEDVAGDRLGVDVHAAGAGGRTADAEGAFQILDRKQGQDDYSFSTSGLRLHMARELVRSLGGQLRYEVAGEDVLRMEFDIPLPQLDPSADG